MEVVEQEAEERTGESARPARRPRRRFMPLLRPVLVAGALLLGAAAGFGVARLSEEEPQESRTLAAKVDQSRIPDASGRLVVQGQGDNGAILRVQGMPSLQPDQVYQAWVLRDGAIVPQPTFDVGDTGGGAVAIPDNLSGAQEVLVTRERRGGARAPTEEPILAVRL